ncbi:hypothetical protein SANTM175S_01177 [Streptomyces antimycoticus]
MAAMTPMFSEYVVLAGPPTEVEIMVAAPSAAIAVPSWSSSGSPIISPTAFTCPAFSAISAITTGSATSTADQWKLGACSDGRPIQSALATPDRSSRQWSVTRPLPSIEWILPKTRSRTQETA